MRLCLRSLNGAEWQGGEIYIRNLAAAIAALPPAERTGVHLSVEVRRPTPESLDAFRASADRVFVPGRAAIALRGWAKRRRTRLPDALTNPHGFDFVYPELAGSGVSYGWAGWIPDFQYRHLPELFPAEELRRRKATDDAIADAAPRVVLSSDAAREDFADAYPKHANKAVVLHFASSMPVEVFQGDPGAAAQRYGLPEQYFLVSNQIWAHKNHALVIDALARMGPDAPVVACTGGTHDPRDPSLLSRLLARADDLGVSDRFRVLGLIPRADQLQLMRGCVAVVQPSRFEGWSTVVEDAKALGRPVLASDIAVHREQDPPDAVFFSPDDPDALAALIAEHAHASSGPEPTSEDRARADTAGRVRAFGSGFLTIARELTGGS